MFEKASRGKLLYNTGNGVVHTDDLWDISLVSLNKVAKGLNKEVKESVEEDFLSVIKPQDEKLQLKFDIVKHVITVRLAEREEAVNSRAISEHKQLILAELTKRKNDLSALSDDELDARLKGL